MFVQVATISNFLLQVLIQQPGWIYKRNNRKPTPMKIEFERNIIEPKQIERP
jgi:hypothetical protein